MITRNDIHEATAPKQMYSRKKFFILYLDPHKFMGRFPEKKDFIEKVKVQIKGVIAKPGCPMRLSCKNGKSGFSLIREESEVFTSYEDIEKSEKLEKFINNFLENHKLITEDNTRFYLSQIENAQKKINENNRKINLIDNLIKKG